MDNNWIHTIPTLVDDQSGNAATFNRVINALAGRTEYLYTALNSRNDLASSIYTGLMGDADLTVGSFVAFNKATRTFSNAATRIATTHGLQGELLLADTSFAAGVVLRKYTDNTIDILSRGLYRDADTLTAIFGGSTPAPGCYYLTANGISSSPDLLITPILIVLDTERFEVRPNVNALNNHYHRTAKLSAEWFAVSDPVFINMTIPSGATFGYNISADTDTANMFNAFPGAWTIFYQGSLVTDSSFIVNDDGIWSTAATAPAQGSVVIFSWVPFTHGESIIRAASTKSKHLKLSASNGVLNIDENDYDITATDSYNKYAVAAINGNTLQRTRIISGIVPGVGMSCQSYTDGRVVINNTNLDKMFLDPVDVNLNSAVRLVNQPYDYISLPATVSSANIEARYIIPSFTASLTVKAAVTLFVQGSASGTTTVTRLRIQVYQLVMPTTSGVLSTTALLDEEISSFEAAAGTLYRKETTVDSRVTLTSGSLVYVRITKRDASQGVMILRAGLTLYNELTATTEEDADAALLVDGGTF